MISTAAVVVQLFAAGNSEGRGPISTHKRSPAQARTVISKGKPAFDNRPYLKKAMNLFNQKKFKESLVIFNFLIAKEPGQVTHRFNAANVHFEAGNFESALEGYRTVETMPSSLSVVAGVYEAKALRKLGKFSEAEVVLGRTRQDPRSLKIQNLLDDEVEELQAAVLEAAMDRYRKKQYDEALPLVRQSQRVQATPEAEAMESLILLRMGREEEARRSMDRFLSQNPTHAARKEMASLFQLATDGTQDRSKWLFLETAAGYNSNVMLEDSGSSPEKNFFLSLNFAAGARVAKSGNYAGALNYRLYQELILGLADANFSSHFLSQGNSWDNGNWIIRAIPKFVYQSLGSSSFAQKLGLAASVEFPQMTFPATAVLDYTDTRGANGNFAYVSGYARSGRISGKKNWGAVGTEGSLLFAQERSGDLMVVGGKIPLSYDGIGMSIEGLTKWDSQSFIEGGLSYIHKTFQVSGAIPQRVDDLLTFSVRWTRSLDPRFKWFISGDFSMNQSNYGDQNLQNRNYQQFLGWGGVRWEAL